MVWLGGTEPMVTVVVDVVVEVVVVVVVETPGEQDCHCDHPPSATAAPVT